jgi:deazaflavin-dependent oxidoreductase (nitroreductase family)
VSLDPALAQEPYCYLTTTGRVSGQPRTIEIWFALVPPARLYLMAGGRERANWVRNLRRQPAVRVRLGPEEYEGRAHVVDDAQEQALARQLLFDKYSAGYGGDLSSWRETALPVAIDLDAA